MTPGAAIRRGFVDLTHGQVHYRTVGTASDRPTLVMIHQSPGSSKQLEGVMAELAAAGRHIVAPDTAGNGDSEPFGTPAPSIGDLAGVALQAIDILGLDRVDLYGSHTGASIAMEIAIAHPDRVRRLVIDGMGLYSADQQSEVMDRYAREILPDAEATHLMKVWHFCRDQHLFWPYYNRTAAGRLLGGVPDDDYLHDFVVEVLKAMRSYHQSYRAAFRHPKRARLPLIAVPTLASCSPSDMLYEYFAEVASLVPGADVADLAPWGDADQHIRDAAIFATFLDKDISA
ncbi:MAG: alpha/beta hydrolase [Gemmobacter sp.]|nr:alpha/beta hydrolase [Gemmobacter sp.]